MNRSRKGKGKKEKEKEKEKEKVKVNLRKDVGDHERKALNDLSPGLEDMPTMLQERKFIQEKFHTKRNI